MIFMIFRKPQKKVEIPVLHIGGENIDCVNNFNFLGIVLNHHLNWHKVRSHENCLVSEQKVVFDRSWKLKLLSAHSKFLIWLTICRRTKYAIIKKIEGDAILSRSF